MLPAWWHFSYTEKYGELSRNYCFIQIKHSFLDCKLRNLKSHVKVGTFRMDTLEIQQ